MLLLIGSTHAIYAQAAGGKEASSTFNPENPPEPLENLYYKVTVSASPAAAAYASGSGKFLAGKSTDIRYSIRNSSYTFSHWTLNGEKYSTSNSFTYKVDKKDAEFVAHFNYTPTSPSEPNANYKYRLNLESSNANACSFNIASGTKVEYDNYIQLIVYPNQGYDFQGWYDGNTLVSSSTRFNYLMPDRNVTLTARFKYNPASPSEPNGDGTQTDVQTTPTGDFNKDGVVDIFDVVDIINRSLDSEAEELGAYDLNGDDIIDIFDVVKIINLSLE